MLPNYQTGTDGGEVILLDGGAKVFKKVYNNLGITLYDGDVVKVVSECDWTAGIGYMPLVTVPLTDSARITEIGIVANGGAPGNSLTGTIADGKWGYVQVRGVCERVSLDGTTSAFRETLKATNTVYTAETDATAGSSAITVPTAKSFGSALETYTAKTITAASNASPIVITCAAHGLTTGDTVTVAAVGGNTAANARWKVTVLTVNTFSLDGSTGNGAYTSGGTFTKAIRVNLFGTLVTV